MTQKTKEQKLSPMRYIKNNKRRVSVLIVSLCLCMAIIYVANFLVMTTHATGKKIYIDNYKKAQYMYLTPETMGMNDVLFGYSKPELTAYKLEFRRHQAEVAKKLMNIDGVKDVFPCGFASMSIRPPFGSMNYKVPLVSQRDADKLMEHFGAKLCEGRLPQQKGEVVLDTATKLNKKQKLGDHLITSDGMEQLDYTIVGFLECETYFGYGLKDEKQGSYLCVLTDKAINALPETVQGLGYEINNEYDHFDDCDSNKETFEKYFVKELETATKLIYVGIFVLLFISLFVVYVTYLRDRHNEWCLYCSIGYSRKAIYLSIMGELMFTFVVAVVAGVIITAVTMIVLKYALLAPIGIACSYIYPKNFAEIICAFVLLMGLLQMPIRHALCKIRTIDAMEDDLY